MGRGLEQPSILGLTTSAMPAGVQTTTEPDPFFFISKLGKPYAPHVSGIPTVRKGDGTEGNR
jgi:hypothetical protein